LVEGPQVKYIYIKGQKSHLSLHRQAVPASEREERTKERGKSCDNCGRGGFGAEEDDSKKSGAPNFLPSTFGVRELEIFYPLSSASSGFFVYGTV
jgi:hypothetical protein